MNKGQQQPIRIREAIEFAKWRKISKVHKMWVSRGSPAPHRSFPDPVQSCLNGSWSAYLEKVPICGTKILNKGGN